MRCADRAALAAPVSRKGRYCYPVMPHVRSVAVVTKAFARTTCGQKRPSVTARTRGMTDSALVGPFASWRALPFSNLRPWPQRQGRGCRAAEMSLECLRFVTGDSVPLRRDEWQESVTKFLRTGQSLGKPQRCPTHNLHSALLLQRPEPDPRLDVCFILLAGRLAIYCVPGFFPVRSRHLAA